VNVRIGLFVVGAVLSGLGALSLTAQSQALNAPFMSFKTVKSFPHDTKCFTQGLQWIGKGFLESCGQTGESNLREVTLEGKVLRQKALPKNVFAEGLVVLAGKAYQLTWQEGYGFIHDAASFKDMGTFKYPKPIEEGWGLTTDGRSLILSDGSSKLYWLNPKTFAVERTITVRNGSSEVSKLNELEFIGGEVWANVWMTDLIARIDAKTGRVTAWVNFTGLRPQSSLGDSDAVLNGIAYDPSSKRIFVTGKRWDRVFEVQIVKR
jgi:glutaminyl-peptide cyclotransferase